MAIKIVQNVNRISPTVSVAATSNPIALKSGYIRVAAGSTSVFVETGGDPVATTNSFYISPFGNEVLKERIARQKISGITTGTSTIVTLPDNGGNPFVVGDFATIEGAVARNAASTSGINTIHQLVSATTESTITLSTNTSSITGVITSTNATIARSVKVSALAEGASTNVSITEVVSLVSE
jgi:hypothetical protein